MLVVDDWPEVSVLVVLVLVVVSVVCFVLEHGTQTLVPLTVPGHCAAGQRSASCFSVKLVSEAGLVAVGVQLVVATVWRKMPYVLFATLS